MENYHNTLCQNLATLRKAQNLTQEQLGEKLGLTFQAISKWENGLSCPDIGLLPIICDIFDVSLDALFGRTSPSSSSYNLLEVQAPAMQTMTPSIDDLSWPDDGALRAVAYIGHKRVRKHEINTLLKESKFTFAYKGDALDVKSHFALECDTIQGNATAGSHINCNRIEKDANAGSHIKCETIAGNANAGSHISCDNIGGGAISVGKNHFSHETKEDTPVQGQMTADLPWPNDNTLRAVAYIGHKRMMEEEISKILSRQDITFHYEGEALDVICQFNLQCDNIEGSATVGGNVNCDSINNTLTAGGSVNCDSVNGSLTSGGNVNCDSVNGNATANGSLTCDSIEGDAQAGGSITCDNIGGDASAGGDMQADQIEGSVTVGGNLTCETIHGDVTANGNIECETIEGDVQCEGQVIQNNRSDDEHETATYVNDLPWPNDDTIRAVAFIGHRYLQDQELHRHMHDQSMTIKYEGDALNVSSQFNLNCQTVEGDAHAGGDLTCENVERSASAGGNLQCENVEGNANANGNMTCANIDGQATAGGNLAASEIGGSAKAGGSITCTDIEGNADAGGEIKASDIVGDVRAGGNVRCGDVGGDVKAEGHVECESIEGSVQSKGNVTIRRS